MGLQNPQQAVKLRIKNTRIVCPACKRMTYQVVRTDTEAKNLQVFCRECKWNALVNIADGQCFMVSPCR